MKPFYKKKFSKVTIKTHHKDKIPPKEEAREEVKGSGAPVRPEDVHIHKPQ